MRGKLSIASATLVLLAALALIAAAEFLPYRSAGRPMNSGDSPGKTVVVVIRGFKFEPATVTVRAGEIVEWKNEDIVPHTVTADAEVAHKPVFDSGTIGTGAAWRYVAQKKGTYNYTCDYHPNMTGKLIVQ
jgi:plastocyanin